MAVGAERSGNGVNVNATDEHGDRSLILASGDGYTTMVEILLRHSGDVPFLRKDGNNLFSEAKERTIADCRAKREIPI